MNMRLGESPPWKWSLISLTRFLRYRESQRQTYLGFPWAHGSPWSSPVRALVRFRPTCAHQCLFPSRACSTRTVGCSLSPFVWWWRMMTLPRVRRWHPWRSNPYSVKSTLRKKIGSSTWLPPGSERRRSGSLLVIIQWKVLDFGVATLRTHANTLLN